MARKRRTTDELIAAKQEEIQKLIERKERKEREGKSDDPRVRTLKFVLNRLRTARNEIKVDVEGYFTEKRGWHRKPLSVRITEAEEKLNRMYERRDALETLPGLVEETKELAESLLERFFDGEDIEVPEDIMPEVLRDPKQQNTEVETAFIAKENEREEDA